MTLIEIPGLSDALLRADQRELRLGKDAEEIAELIGGVEPLKVKGLLNGILSDFRWRAIATDVEKGTEAQASLDEIEAKANALASAIKRSGWGAMTLLHLAAQTERDEAELDELPDRDPHGGPPNLWQAPEAVQHSAREEWERGGQWVIRLEALAKVAQQAGRLLTADKAVGKGKKLGKYLFGGTPEDWLAGTCQKEAERHGFDQPGVALLMHQAVLRSWTAENDPKARAGRVPRGRKSQAGRKAITAASKRVPK